MVPVSDSKETIVPLKTAAKATGISLRTLQYWINRGELRTYQRGPSKRVYVDLRDLEFRPREAGADLEGDE